VALVPIEAVLRIKDSYTTKTTAVITSVLYLENNHLVVGAEDNTIQICTSSSSSSSCSYMQGEGHTGAITGLTRTKNRLLFVSSSIDTTLIVWNAQTKLPTVRLVGHSKKVGGVVSLADGSVASCAADAVKVWDIDTGENTRSFTPQIVRSCNAIAASYDGLHLFVSLEAMLMGQRNSMVYVFDTATWTYKKVVSASMPFSLSLLRFGQPPQHRAYNLQSC